MMVCKYFVLRRYYNSSIVFSPILKPNRTSVYYLVFTLKTIDSDLSSVHLLMPVLSSDHG